MSTRLPVLFPDNPRSEHRSWQRVDPFPDPDIGPDTGFRPPDFSRPRTIPRKAAEQRLLQGLPVAPQPVAPTGGPLQSGRSYPSVVR